MLRIIMYNSCVLTLIFYVPAFILINLVIVFTRHFFILTQSPLYGSQQKYLGLKRITKLHFIPYLHTIV